MSDRKTVVEDLGLCLKGLCEYCSHKGSDAPGGCRDELIHAAMVELEQTSVKPTYRRGKTYCGNCGYRLYMKVENNYCQNNYCRNCGRSIKWE